MGVVNGRAEASAGLKGAAWIKKIVFVVGMSALILLLNWLAMQDKPKQATPAEAKPQGAIMQTLGKVV